ncbi:MAG TPA: hypothetical protein VKZ63_12495, partial [Kofleriaceae bacterium]|nr:hypothetical protein [Kofleriaceae bacterium]
RIFLSDGQQYVPADLVGDQLTVHLPDGQIVFTRSGGAAGGAGAVAGGAAAGAPGAPAAAAPALPARTFEPQGTLAGEVVSPPGAGAEFTVPDGWTHGPTRNQDGSEAYGIQDGKGAGIVLTRRVLSPAEQGSAVSALLRAAIQELVGGQPVETVVAPEDLDIGGQRGARAILRGMVNGRQMELYIGGVVVEHNGFLMAALYEAGEADRVRPAFETVLVTFRGSTPPENAQLRGQLIGCWEHYEGDSSVNGSYSHTTRIQLNRDGSYFYRSFSSVTAGGIAQREKKDAGRYRVEGNTLIGVSSQDGSVSSYQVALQGGILHLSGTKYLPCRT